MIHVLTVSVRKVTHADEAGIVGLSQTCLHLQPDSVHGGVCPPEEP